jgi:hypothetical protein
LVKDNDGNLLAVSHRSKNYFRQLLNIHGADDVRQCEIHTADPLVHELNSFEAETASGTFKDL